MYEFLCCHPWLFPVYGVLLIIVSPVYVPVMLVINYSDEVMKFYGQCWFAITDWKKL